MEKSGVNMKPGPTKIQHQAMTGVHFAPEVFAWLDSLRASGLSERTLACYSGDLRDVGLVLSTIVGHECSTSDLARIRQDEVNIIVQEWSRVGAVAALTVLRRFAALRGFAKYLCTTVNLDCSGILAAVLPAADRTERQAISLDFVQAITSRSLYSPTWIGDRDRTIDLIQHSAALTTSEVVALDCRAVLGDYHALSIAAETFSPRLASISNEAAVSLQCYRFNAPFEWSPDRPLFMNQCGRRLSVRSVQVSFRRRRRTLGLPSSATPMSLRHSTAKQLADAGRSPAFVAQALGTSVHSVARYFEHPRRQNNGCRSHAGRDNRRRARAPLPGNRPASKKPNKRSEETKRG
jgi:integrase/recombinase XerC